MNNLTSLLYTCIVIPGKLEQLDPFSLSFCFCYNDNISPTYSWLADTKMLAHCGEAITQSNVTRSILPLCFILAMAKPNLYRMCQHDEFPAYRYKVILQDSDCYRL